MPQTVLKAREILADPHSSVEEVAKVLETDQAIGARVLKMANSPFYGLMGKVSSIRHASAVLGYKTLGDIVTMAGTSGLLGKTLRGLRAGGRRSVGALPRCRLWFEDYRQQEKSAAR